MTKDDVRKLITDISGCDGSSEYAKGWDDACQVLLDALERDCTNRSYEYQCDWSPAAGRGYCDKWKREVKAMKIEPRKSTDCGGILMMPLRKNVPRPTNRTWKLTTCPKCGEECWDRPLPEGYKEEMFDGKLCTMCALKAQRR